MHRIGQDVTSHGINHTVHVAACRHTPGVRAGIIVYSTLTPVGVSCRRYDPQHMQLRVTQLSASYGVRTILRGISFELQRGEVLVVSGPNGSGKSTLLRILAGLQMPASGSVSYTVGDHQLDLRDMRHLIGWVAPDLSLYRELSGIENLRFFADVRGLAISDAELHDLLRRVGLGERGHDRLAAYSSGMTQRLRYAFALLHRPPVLLLDEPTVTLDERGTAFVEQIITDQRQRGLTVIATNDPRELRYADLLLKLY